MGEKLARTVVVSLAVVGVVAVAATVALFVAASSPDFIEYS